MVTKSRNKVNAITFTKELSKLQVNKAAREVGFMRRRPKKISPQGLIYGFLNCGFSKTFSLGRWAACIGADKNSSVSKQAIAERVNNSFVNLLKHLIGAAMLKKTARNGKALCRFKNVYIQDSTCLKLPDALKENFKGNYSLGKIKAVAKLQVVFNLMSASFKKVDLTPYSKNDQAASIDVLEHLKSGDVVIRDLGYFVIGVLKKIKEKKADFVSRIKSNVTIFDANTGHMLHLATLLKNRQFLKKKVLIGHEKLEVTLIAIRTSEDVKHYRKFRMLNDRDKRKKVSIEKLNLLGWDIFISSVHDLSSTEIRELYRIRWQIEIIFKSWKSHLGIENNISPHLKKPELFCATIFLTLLMIILIIMPVYKNLMRQKKEVSLIKLTQFLTLLLPSYGWSLNTENFRNISYYVNYDTRNRGNMIQKFQLLT